MDFSARTSCDDAAVVIVILHACLSIVDLFGGCNKVVLRR